MPQSDWPIVRQGHSDNDAFGAVTIIQHLLNYHGGSMDVDGVFGPQTDATVRDFERSRNLTVDGIVGNQTWEALVVQVANGSRGDAVKAVQSAFPALDADGIFGPSTEHAVRELQEMFGLAVDGVVGPETWFAIVIPKSE
ncbi:MAG: peptidoglycan-binding protein [Actinomycetota bacterium]|nr:peptidoglycan-binding protein [Actinomycetota bacterium]MDQ3680719.1 peptidoglycan-binding protein [Actinomycetota bacterium]